MARVIDQSPEFLRYLSQAGLEIGAQGSLVRNDAARDSMTIRHRPTRTKRSRATPPPN